MDDGGFEPVHDYLTTALFDLVDVLGELEVDGSHESGKAVAGECMACEVRMIAHEGIGVDNDAVLVLIFEEEVIIKLFGAIFFEEPRVIVALPRDMKNSSVEEGVLSCEVGHAPKIKHKVCQTGAYTKTNQIRGIVSSEA